MRGGREHILYKKYKWWHAHNQYKHIEKPCCLPTIFIPSSLRLLRHSSAAPPCRLLSLSASLQSSPLVVLSVPPASRCLQWESPNWPVVFHPSPLIEQQWASPVVGFPMIARVVLAVVQVKLEQAEWENDRHSGWREWLCEVSLQLPDWSWCDAWDSRPWLTWKGASILRAFQLCQK